MSDQEDMDLQKRESEMQGMSIAGKIIGLMVILWLVSVSYYAFAFFALGMLPSVLAIMIDRGKGRFASQTISACNFVGILPFLFDIALNYEKSVAAKEIMMEPFTWAVIYGFALIGLMLIFVLPNIMAIAFSLKAEYKLNKLIKEQEELVEEWGEEVKTGK